MIRFSILVFCFLLSASSSALAIEVTLAMPEDPLGFTGDTFDCRDAPIRNCRGLLLVDPAGSPSLRGVHAGFTVRNDGAQAIDDLWLSLHDFGDADLPGIVNLGPGESGVVQVGPLDVGESAPVFIHLIVSDPTDPLPTGPEVRPKLSLFDGPPDTGTPLFANSAMSACPNAGRLCRLVDGSVQVPMIYADTLRSSPIQNYRVEPDRPTPMVGQSLTVTAIGTTGRLAPFADYDDDGDLDSLIALSPVPYASWPADALRLTNAHVTTSGVDACPLSDCTCTTDPPAPTECDFVRDDGLPPACELRTRAVPEISTSTCVVEEFSSTLQLIVDSDPKRDFYAEYRYQAVAITGDTVLFPILHLTSGAQLKHTDTGSLSLCDLGDGIDPQSTGCCAEENLTCVSVVPQDEIFADGFEVSE